MCFRSLDGINQGAPDNRTRIASKGARKDLYKNAQKGVPENTLKPEFQVALELCFSMQLEMH